MHRTPAADQADFTKGLFFAFIVCLLIQNDCTVAHADRALVFPFGLNVQRAFADFGQAVVCHAVYFPSNGTVFTDMNARALPRFVVFRRDRKITFKIQTARALVDVV